MTEWLDVESSNIASIRYDDKARYLDIQFVKGSIYRYFKVPSEVANALRVAPSVGKYFAAHIKHIFDAEKYREGM